MIQRLLLKALFGLAIAAAAAPALADGCKLEALMQLPVTMQGSRPVVTTRINGAEAHFAIDSGAFFSMLTTDAANRFRLATSTYTPTGSHLGRSGGVTIEGATGEAVVGVTTVAAFGDGNRPIRNVQFLVGGREDGIDGYLGQNILGGVDAEYDLANGLIRLWKTEGCSHKNLAYWSPGGAAEAPLYRSIDYVNRHILSEATVNGRKTRLILDTGAPRSILDARAAARAGVPHDGPNVVSAGFTRGVGGQRAATWIAPVDSFKIGDEEIRNTRLRAGALTLEEADMVLGADFFLSHRIYVGRSVGSIFITYNGGPVFQLDRSDGDAGQLASGATGAATPYSDEPKDAAGFARRAAASVERGGFRSAEADLTRAVELDAKNPAYLLQRARVRLSLKEPQPARADLDQAIALDAKLTQALELRGALKLEAKDAAGAKADFDAAVALDPDARLDIDGELEHAGDYAGAIAQLDQWIAANPKSSRLGEALNSRCWARALGNVQLQEALADCNRAVQLTNRDPNVLDSRGLVHVRLGQYDAAVADYDAVLRLEPKSAWSLYGRGIAKRRKGLTAEGDADLKAAADIAPRLPDEAKRLGLAS